MKFIDLDIEYFRNQARLFRGRAAGARTAQSRTEFLAVAEAVDGFIIDVVNEGMVIQSDANEAPDETHG
jgi:hypothetical protein